MTLLGERGIAGPDGRAVPLPSRKAWALLALLLSTPGRPWPRAGLWAMLWPLSGEGQARASLRQEVSVLRRALAAAGWEPIEATPETVRIDPDGADIDVRRLVHAPGDPQARLEGLRAYRGELLAGLPHLSDPFEAWLETERREMRARAMRMGLELAEAGPAGMAEEAARLVLRIEPTSERAFAVLARALAARGERTEALRAYEGLRAALREDLDAEPSAGTRDLVEALRRDAAPTAPSANPSPSADPAPARPAPPAGTDPEGGRPSPPSAERRPRRRLWIAAALAAAIAAPFAWGGVRYAAEGTVAAGNPICWLPGAAGTPEPLRLGVVAPMDEAFGRRQAWGVERYLRDARRDLPFAVDVSLRDSEGDVDVLAAILAEFEEAGVDAVIGPMQSRLAWDAKRWGAAREVPVLSPLASAAYLARPGEGDYFFRLGMSDSVRARSLVQWIKARSQHVDPYIVHEWREPGPGEPQIYGASQAEAVKALLGGPARTIRFARGDEEGQRAAAARIGDDGRAVLVFGYTSNIINIVRAMQERGLTNEIFLMGVVMTAIEEAGLPDPSRLHVVSNVNSEARNLEDSARLRRIFEEENPDLGYDLSAWYAYDATDIAVSAAAKARARTCGGRIHGPFLAEALRETPGRRRAVIHGGFLEDTQEVFFASDGFEIVEGRFRPVGIGP